MRKANVNDMFKLARVINELNLKDDIFKAQQGKEDIERIGFDLMFDILAKATSKDVQMKLYDVLSGPFEIDPEKVGEMDIDKLIESFQKCFNSKTLLNFIKRAGK